MRARAAIGLLGILFLSGRATSQTVVQYGVLTDNTQTSGIAAGPDGNVWFTEPGAAKDRRMRR